VLGRAARAEDADNLGLERQSQPASSASRRWNNRIRRWKPLAASWKQGHEESRGAADASQARADALTRRERDLAVHSREAIDAAVREAREAISEIVREAKRTRTAQAVEAARAALERKAKETTAALPEAEALDVTKLRQSPGQSRAGRVLDEQEGQRVVRQGERATRRACVHANWANTLDLRGQRADEALAELRRFSIARPLEGADVVFVIHGHGTGALRKVVREYLADFALCRALSPGGKGEGGDGVSVVSLRG